MTEINQTRCDQCSKTADRANLRGWKRVLPELLDRYPQEPHPEPRELCSWICVAEYAQAATRRGEMP